MEQIVSYLKEKQKEYEHDSHTYNLLRHLEIVLPAMINEALRKPAISGAAHEHEEDIEPDEQGNVKCRLCKEIIGHAGG